MSTTVSHSFARCKGINNIDEPSRSGKSDESYWLETGTNIDIDKTGFVSRRDGFALAKSGEYKFLWSGDGEKGYAIHNSDLVILDKVLGETILLSDVGMGEMVFAQVGEGVYCTNGSIIKFILNGVVYSLHSPTSIDPNLVNKATMPSGHLIADFNGRLVVVDNSGAEYPSIMYISDGGAQYEIYDLESGVIPLPHMVTILGVVDDGMFISTDKIYFLSGSAPEEWFKNSVADYKALKGTVVEKENLLVGTPDGKFVILERAVVFTTEEGICIGGNRGAFYNLTQLQYDMPDMVVGSAFIRKFKGIHQYLVVGRS